MSETFKLEDYHSRMADKLIGKIRTEAEKIKLLPLESQVDALNEIREIISDVSPFKSEPIDRIKWVKADDLQANDYNPNSVAPPEMELLRHSILSDGYTQPIVAFSEESHYTVIDGFHRNRVGKECEDVRERIKGYLPITIIKPEREDRNDRIASTIRHNRARGKHQIEAMSDIVIELKRRNWTDERICKELGMDQDEVLRLCQITGLAEMFSDTDFSAAWDIEGDISEDDFMGLDDINESDEFRKVHTGGENRIFHTYENWECYKAGFYNTTKEGMSKDECEQAYRDFLSDSDRFENTLKAVTTEWEKSCEHYLTNESMNRIAWLGQASACYALGIPSVFRGGFNLLTPIEQEAANQLALKYLNQWLEKHDRPALDMDSAISGRQSDIY